MVNLPRLTDLPDDILELISETCHWRSIHNLMLTCRRYQRALILRFLVDRLLDVCLPPERCCCRLITQMVSKQIQCLNTLPNGGSDYQTIRGLVRRKLSYQQAIYILDNLNLHDYDNHRMRYFIHDLHLDIFAEIAPGMVLNWFSMGIPSHHPQQPTVVKALALMLIRLHWPYFPHYDEIRPNIRDAFSGLSAPYCDLLERFKNPFSLLFFSYECLRVFRDVAHLLLRRLPDHLLKDPDFLRDLLRIGIRFELYSYLDFVQITAEEFRKVALFLSRIRTSIHVVFNHLIQDESRHNLIPVLLSIPELVNEFRDDLEISECLNFCLQWRHFNLYRQLSANSSLYIANIQQIAGSNLLHAAISYNAPLDIIDDLITKYPEMARQKDRNGTTPLHLALNKHKDSLFLRMFGQLYPEGKFHESAI